MPVTIDEDMFPDIRHVIFRKCTPGWEMPEHELSACNLTYLIQGEARYIINGQTIELKQGSLLILPKNCIRKGITFPDRLMHCFSVEFNLKNSRNQELTPPFPLVTQPGRHEDIIQLLHELSFSWIDKQPGYLIKCKGLFLQIIHRFLELVVIKSDSFAGDSRITKVIRYIAAHYPEHITVKKMAEIAGLNSTYFGALFRQTMGMGFLHYLIQTRIRNAENMLSSGEYKVGNVAEACGFTDVSHFYKQFKQIKGYPPSHSLLSKVNKKQIVINKNTINDL